MKRYFSFLLVSLGILWASSAVHAGSDRWIMSITPERMTSEKLIHARFMGADGSPVESDSLKIMEIRNADCATGELFSTPDGYKFGFDPETKLIGIMLPSGTWMSKTLCFTVQGLGKIKTQLGADSLGKSIVLTLEQ